MARGPPGTAKLVTDDLRSGSAAAPGCWGSCCPCAPVMVSAGVCLGGATWGLCGGSFGVAAGGGFGAAGVLKPGVCLAPPLVETESFCSDSGPAGTEMLVQDTLRPPVGCWTGVLATAMLGAMLDAMLDGVPRGWSSASSPMAEPAGSECWLALAFRAGRAACWSTRLGTTLGRCSRVRMGKTCLTTAAAASVSSSREMRCSVQSSGSRSKPSTV